MRFRGLVLLLLATTACESAELTGLSAGEPAQIASQPSNPTARPMSLIVCRRGSRSTGPLYLVDGRIVTDSVGRAAAQEPGAVVELVTGAEATATFGSRASEGAVLVRRRASGEAAR